MHPLLPWALRTELHLHSTFLTYSLSYESLLEKGDTCMCTSHLPELGTLSVPTCLVEVTSRTGHHCPKRCCTRCSTIPVPDSLQFNEAEVILALLDR